MESAAKEEKYDKAVTALADRTKKVDAYYKEVKASEHKNKSEWAKKRKDEFLKIKDEGRTLKEAVSKDNKETIAIFEGMNKSFQEFQKRKKTRKKRFEARIKEIADKVKMYKEVASAILNQVRRLGGPSKSDFGRGESRDRGNGKDFLGHRGDRSAGCQGQSGRRGNSL